MSVIGEVVGIVACVSAIVSAYHDGGAIIEKIKLKRAAKRAPPPPRLLEESIDQAPEEIEREKNRGIQRFGKAFEEGDHIAVIALQQITIQLQSSLLEKLRNATIDDEATLDLASLVDAADLGRDRTIGALFQFKQRLLQATAVSEMPAPTATLSRQTSNPRVPQLSTGTFPIRSAQEPAPARQHKTWTREYSVSREASGGEEDTASGADDNRQHHSAGRKRHSSLLGFLSRHHRSHSGSGDRIPKVSQAVQEEGRPVSSSPTSAPFVPPPQCNASDQQQQQQANSNPPTHQDAPIFNYQDWEDDPSEIWGSKPPSQERRDTVVAPDEPPASTRDLRSLSNAISTVRTNSSQNTSSSAIPTPTPENDYLGFCKGAWRLQNGDRQAMKRCKEFNDGWSRSGWSQPPVYFLACGGHSKCAFAGHLPINRIWQKVYSVEAKGLKFRWPFLAKSHVSQSRVKDHQYAYQCMMCVFLGETGTPVFHGTDVYLDHVASHRGQPLGEVVLYKTKCVADRVAEDDEEFDVNLYPLSAQEEMKRKQSSILPDELLGLDGPTNTGGDVHDSMVSANEPWNEGLSDFHWGGELERSELMG